MNGDRGLNAAAVILAAGRSTRMRDANKLLLEIEPGVAMVRRVAENASASGVGSVIVVTGHEGEKVRSALAGTGCTFAENPDFRDGMATSLQTGFAAAEAVGADGVVVLLGDMPFVSAEIIDKVLEIAREKPARIVQPVSAGKPAHPVWLPIALKSRIDRLEGDAGARNLTDIDKDSVISIEVEDAGALDIDTPEAWDAARRRIGREPA